jgi:hypothetical protein
MARETKSKESADGIQKKELRKRIANALKDMGCVVNITESVGGGYPSLSVGYKGRNLLLEVPQLTEDQIKWHSNWRGQVTVVRGILEAVEAVQSDQAKYRQQKANMMLRERSLAVLGDPATSGYIVTVADSTSTREICLPEAMEPFEIIDAILKLFPPTPGPESGTMKNTSTSGAKRTSTTSTKGK